MFCSTCGLRIINESANYCKRCGKKLAKPSSRFRQNNPNDIFLQAKEKLLQLTSPKIEKTRKFAVSKLDSLQQSILDDKYSVISKDRKTFLAQKFSTLRDRIASREDSAELSVDEAQDIVTISEDLLEQIKDDKCLICYKSLTDPSTGNNTLVICPQCGHGGHKNHTFVWFKEKKTCPYCKAVIKANEVLILNT